MTPTPRLSLPALAVALAIVGGCATEAPPLPPPAPPPVYTPPPAAAPAPAAAPTPAPAPAAAPRPAPAPAPVSPAEKALSEGVAAYDSGDFNGAIRRLSGPELVGPTAPPALKVEALKVSAFSYCVTNRRGPCRRQFDTLLAIDPQYELKPSEAGHPIWGPIFKQAKQAAATRKKR